MAVRHGDFQINLLPKDSFSYSGLGKFLSWATTSGRALVVLTEFVVLLAFGSRFYYDKKVNDLNEEIEQKQLQIEAFAEVETQIRRILAKQIPISDYLEKNLSFKDRYELLTRIMPTEVKLEKLTIGMDEVTMVGESKSELAFTQMLQGLKNTKDIKRVVMKESNFDQTTGGVEFNIQATFK